MLHAMVTSCMQTNAGMKTAVMESKTRIKRKQPVYKKTEQLTASPNNGKLSQLFTAGHELTVTISPPVSAEE